MAYGYQRSYWRGASDPYGPERGRERWRYGSYPQPGRGGDYRRRYGAYPRDYYASEERGFGARGTSPAGEYYGDETRPESYPPERYREYAAYPPEEYEAYPRDYDRYYGGEYGPYGRDYSYADRGIYSREGEDYEPGGWGAGAGYGPMQDYRGRGPRGYRRSDERVREDVCDLLTDDPRIDASNLEVTVKDCEVTLTGTLESRESKRRAEALADEVHGVKDVHNNIRVQEPEREREGAGEKQQAEIAARH